MPSTSSVPGPKFRVLVADDEPAARRGVRQLLAAHPDYVVVGEARNGREALAQLSALAPDVLFLDIQMPEMGGFETLRVLGKAPLPPVVFLTAYEEFAVDAFAVEALDYLVKPVSEARFAKTIARLTRRLTAPEEPGQTLVVSGRQGSIVLNVRDVDWIEAADYYVRVWSGGRGYLLRESLTRLERRVVRHGFLRAHRHALVRLSGVRSLRRSGRGDVTALLACGAAIPIARRRRKRFASAIKTNGQ